MNSCVTLASERMRCQAQRHLNIIIYIPYILMALWYGMVWHTIYGSLFIWLERTGQLALIEAACELLC